MLNNENNLDFISHEMEMDMDIFSFVVLFGGLSFFLYGMSVLSSGLEKMAGGKLQDILQKATSSKWKCLILGMVVTVAIQSSSAVTVMMVGLVNSGIMELGQTIGVLMGSNVGTTLTAWILSLSGIQSDNIWMSFLKPENFSLIFSLVGIIMTMVSKNQKKKDIGHIFIGFAVLIYGMDMMKNSVAPLADMPEFSNMLVAFKNPLIGVLSGAVITGVIQSSAASVGILQALSMTGSITYGIAIPIIMGQNIGTCVTAILSSFGVNKNAKRVAVVHMSFNVIGTVICLIIYFIVNSLVHLPLMDEAISPFGVALAHSIFNIFTTVLLIPFTKQLEWIAKFLIKDTDEKEEYSFLDERLIKTPSVAIYECNILTMKMAEIAKKTLTRAISLFSDYDEEIEKKVRKNEEKLDYYEDEIGTFLVKLSGKEISEKDSVQVSKMLHTISDFERIGDHAKAIMDASKEIRNKNMKFSDHAMQELHTLEEAIKEIIDITVEAYQKDDTVLAQQVEPLEQVIDRMIAKMRDRHIIRLKEGRCTIENGFAWSELLNNYSRVSDHCSNIAVATIEVDNKSFETHQYLQQVKYVGDEKFNEAFVEYALKYELK